MSAPHPPDRRIPYQPALDGLRALAVAAVLFYHHQGSAPPDALGHGGFIGVDIFFVLSGYLITSLLLAEHFAAGRIALREFWVRRLRRLAPALLLMVAFTVVLARTVLSDRLAGLVRQDTPWVLTYLSNWRIAFGHGSVDSPLSHTWSLAVEEQWYLLWPAVLLVFLHLTRRRKVPLAITVGGLAVATSLWGWYLYEQEGLGRAFFGTDFRAQELLVGAVLAVVGLGGTLVVRRGSGAIQFLGLLTLAGLVGIALFNHDGDGWFPFGRFALAGLVAIVIAVAVQPRGAVRSVLAVAPLVLLGQISYGVYLFHFPIFRWLTPASTGVEGLTLFGLRVLVTLAIATVSYRLVEQPIRHGRIPTRVVLPVGAIVAAGVLVVATVGVASPVALPTSPLLAKVLPAFAARGPQGMPHVLVVGGRRAELLSATTLHQPTREGDTWALAIGDPTCGLTLMDPRCRIFSDDLAAISAAFRSDVVVLMLDEQDLARLGGRSEKAVKAMVARLDALSRSVGARRTVVVTLPCNTTLGPVVHRVNDAVRAWATERGIRSRSLAGLPCADGVQVPTPTRDLWNAIVTATSGR